MKRKLKELVDRVLGLLPRPYPIFDVGPNQKMTIVVETEQAQSSPIQIARMTRLLRAVDRLVRFDGPALFVEKARAPYNDWCELREARQLFKDPAPEPQGTDDSPTLSIDRVDHQRLLGDLHSLLACMEQENLSADVRAWQNRVKESASAFK